MTSDNIHINSGSYYKTVNGDVVGGNKYVGTEKQTLADAAAEIEALLKQLEQIYPTNTEAEQEVVADKAVKKIENNPTLKQRVISAVKQGSLAALEKAIDNPAGAFVIKAIEGWQEVE